MTPGMTEEELKLPVRSLLIFVDETGNEDLSDPKNPTFGRGGCGCLYPAYRDLIKKPWCKLSVLALRCNARFTNRIARRR